MNNPYLFCLILCLAAANLCGFFAMAVDKQKAKRHAWRIPESRFFLIALLGGSLGVLLGMYCFRHKTKHWYFVWGIPLILALQLTAAVLLHFGAFS